MSSPVSKSKKRKANVSNPLNDEKVGKKLYSTLTLKDYVVPSIHDEAGKFRFRSETDITKVYEVKILNNGKFSCNCGQKWGEASRGHCKHVSSVLKEMIIQYSGSIGLRGKQTEINNMLDSLKI